MPAPAKKHSVSVSLLREELRALFRDLNEVPWTPHGTRTPPAVDVIETPDAVEIRVDLMAVAPDELGVEIDGDELTIRGGKRLAREEKAGHARRARSHVRRFARRIQIPPDLVPRGFEARVKNGLLDVLLLKRGRA